MRIVRPAILIAVGLLAIGPKLSSADTPSEGRPNILWIVSEDNDPFLGCYGDPRARTPRLDGLAAEGVLYTHAFANAPVCAPSRSTLITGMYASTLGTLHMRSRYRVPAEIGYYCTYLRNAGYYCMNPGKTDYNIAGTDLEPWQKGKTWSDAPPGKPWMLVLNNFTTHESALHGSTVHPEFLKEPFPLPPYHPDTPEIRSNWVEYYRDMTKMDGEMGEILDRLSAAGLADDTIVFYYSDHGGILPRSKRYVYDSGLHVPLIIRFGKHFQNLAPAPPGTKLDRLVSFVDLAPSLLSLAGAEIPRHLQGAAFLGPKSAAPRSTVFGFRGRMDERTDLSYTIRDSRYRYIRNYLPHRIYGQRLDYLWKMPAMASWEKAYKEGKCDQAQSAFWRAKPTEELYDEVADPYEVRNLADLPEEEGTLRRLRGALQDQLIQNRDAGLMPESEMVDRAKGGAIYSMTQDDARYPMARILEAAELASRRDESSVPQLIERMKDSDAAIRYWAAVGCSVRGKKAAPAIAALGELQSDSSPCARIAASEALVRLGQPAGLDRLVSELELPGGDALAALDALASLGDLALPAKAAIQARLQKSLAGPGRVNGESGPRLVDLAAADLLKILGPD
ncbi:MAG TPA: sulfatase-like hydrolase/transferase [Planctomycetota bacterium]|nr:sulfatase-like hydrolase/transferase [Planctomycetota bacterium]